MFEMIIAIIMIAAGFCVGLAKVKYFHKSDLPEIVMTILLVMGWFQASVYMVEWIEQFIGFSLVEFPLIAFIGFSSLIFTGLSLFFIQKIASKIQDVA
jgi:hypothetical protein